MGKQGSYHIERQYGVLRSDRRSDRHLTGTSLDSSSEHAVSVQSSSDMSRHEKAADFAVASRHGFEVLQPIFESLPVKKPARISRGSILKRFSL